MDFPYDPDCREPGHPDLFDDPDEDIDGPDPGSLEDDDFDVDEDDLMDLLEDY